MEGITHTFIAGGIGSGKSHLAQMLSTLTKADVVSLDAIFFDFESPIHRKERDTALKDAMLHLRLVQPPSIFEGWHFGDWLIPLYRCVSLVIIIDAPLELREQRIEERFNRRKAGLEFDPFPRGGTEHLANLLRWTRMFDADRAEKEIRAYSSSNCRFLRDAGFGTVLNQMAQPSAGANGLPPVAQP